MKLLKKIICFFRGHDFPGHYLFHGNALCFCTRCGVEVAVRTFADLEPMTAEEREEWDLLDF
jgi:hypothetical protein